MTDYFIIGADAAGLSAAIQIKRHRPEASITIINKGEIISYGACGIPYVLSGDITSETELIHFTPETFERQRGISVQTGKEATHIDPQKHSVTVKDLKSGTSAEERYGKLLIATGAQPITLPFLNPSMEGVFSVHDIEDLRQILGFIRERRPQTAAIIGTGNIGLEVAEALTKLGIVVSLFDILEKPAAGWPPLAQNAALKKIKEKGISFFGGTSIDTVTPSGGSFILKSGQAQYTADVVFSVVGIKPATGFCSGRLDTLPNGAVLIDPRGQSSAADVYAAGDCASVFHKTLKRQVYFPLGSTANKMGRIAGMNMAGVPVSFPGIVGTQILKFFELSMAKTGLDEQAAAKEGYSSAVLSATRPQKAGYYPGAGRASVDLVVDKTSHTLLGACAVSTGNAAQFIDPAAVAVFSGMTMADLAWFDFAYAPPFAPVWNALISAAIKAG